MRSRCSSRSARCGSFPVYYLLLAALAIAHALFYQRGVNLGLAWHATFLSNYWIGVVKDGWPGSTSHFWSLAVEQQFYLIAPLTLLAVPAARHVALGIAAVALCARASRAVCGRCIAGADLRVFAVEFRADRTGRRVRWRSRITAAASCARRRDGSARRASCSSSRCPRSRRCRTSSRGSRISACRRRSAR
jgi:peptidoglycan/LPS O-acetylase OafA/YrhL